MKIKWLGSGSFFSTQAMQCNFVVTTAVGKNILFDCGQDIKWSLKRAGLTYGDIDAICITHCHGDHMGGLETFCHWDYHVLNQRRPVLYADVEVMDQIRTTLKASTRGIQGKVVDLEDYFVVNAMNVNRVYFNAYLGIELETVQAIHIANGHGYVPNFGFMFSEGRGPTVYYTSDTMFAPDTIRTFYGQADLILHDVEFGIKTVVHANSEDLQTLPDDVKAKMILHHAGDGILDFVPCPCGLGHLSLEVKPEIAEYIRSNGFYGIATPGLEIDVDAALTSIGVMTESLNLR